MDILWNFLKYMEVYSLAAAFQITCRHLTDPLRKWEKTVKNLKAIEWIFMKFCIRKFCKFCIWQPYKIILFRGWYLVHLLHPHTPKCYVTKIHFSKHRLLVLEVIFLNGNFRSDGDKYLIDWLFSCYIMIWNKCYI